MAHPRPPISSPMAMGQGWRQGHGGPLCPTPATGQDCDKWPWQFLSAVAGALGPSLLSSPAGSGRTCRSPPMDVPAAGLHHVLTAIWGAAGRVARPQGRSRTDTGDLQHWRYWGLLTTGFVMVRNQPDTSDPFRERQEWSHLQTHGGWDTSELLQQRGLGWGSPECRSPGTPAHAMLHLPPHRTKPPQGPWRGPQMGIRGGSRGVGAGGAEKPEQGRWNNQDHQ